jgi:large subunit ribosomal protein L22
MSRVKAQAKWVRYAPRKLDRVVKLIRRQKALAALQLLSFMPQKGARIIEKVIKAAVANAKTNYKMKEEDLFIAEAFVNKGIVMKRIQPRARGRAFSILKRTSHLTVWVSAKEAANGAKG